MFLNDYNFKKEFFSMGHSTANVCLQRLHGCVLDFIHLSAVGVSEKAESTNVKGCPHTFVYLVYITCACTHRIISQHTHTQRYTLIQFTHSYSHTVSSATYMLLKCVLRSVSDRSYHSTKLQIL